MRPSESRATEAVVSFRTAEPAASYLELEGPSGRKRLDVSTTPATKHLTWISELAPRTRYTVRVVLKLADGRSLGTRQQDFVTAGEK